MPMKQHKPFSLIEVVLALGVCVIGLCSIMVLFPIGANANRDASMETYAAQAAEQLLNYMKFSVRGSGWDDFQTAMQSLDEFSDLDAKDDPTKIDDDDTWKRVSNSDLGRNLFYHDDYQNGGLYQIVSSSKTSGDLDIDDESIDNRMILRVIATNITMASKQGATTTTVTIDRDYGMRLLVEASWPAEQPYASRQKSIYSLDVFKNN